MGLGIAINVDHPKRRLEDTLIGRIVYFWPIVIGFSMFLMSAGGYVATLHYIGDRVGTIENWVTNERTASQERNRIMARLTTIEEGHESRLKRLEDWYDRR
jgi:hypothetical protein